MGRGDGERKAARKNAAPLRGGTDWEPSFLKAKALVTQGTAGPLAGKPIFQKPEPQRFAIRSTNGSEQP